MENPFTHEELRSILQATYTAVCVAELNPEARDRDEESTRRLLALEQKLFAMADEFGAAQMTALDVPTGNYVPTPELQERSFAARCLKAQEDAIYWDRLVADLADRDLHEEGRLARWDELDIKEREGLLAEAEEKYWDSFEREGIRHLRLATTPAGGGNN